MKFIGEIIKNFLIELQNKSDEKLKMIKYERIYKLINDRDISKIMDSKNIVDRKRRLNYAAKAAGSSLTKWPRSISNKWEVSDLKWAGPLDEFSIFSEWREGIFPKIVPDSNNYKILTMLGQTSLEKTYLKINHINKDYVDNFQKIIEAKFAESSYSKVLFPVSLNYSIYELMNFFISIAETFSFSEPIKNFFRNIDVNKFEYLIKHGKNLNWIHHIIAEKGVDSSAIRIDIVGFNIIFLLKPTLENKKIFSYNVFNNSVLDIERIRSEQKTIHLLWSFNSKADETIDRLAKIHYDEWKDKIKDLGNGEK